MISFIFFLIAKENARNGGQNAGSNDARANSGATGQIASKSNLKCLFLIKITQKYNEIKAIKTLNCKFE
mgnify:CR=1 FL=1